ncbi:AsnC family transcriptional regulator [Vibrio sp. vnigr-6D03]|uniref:Transcriptional regulator n=1 Tax=Vibrio penaeicida TaxID=104609 RepID=A0AAV5NXX9_9VIBR|nr:MULTISPECIES: Lrp/AsnC ligand binding domain-containing protein [Vibrio]PKF76282.1 AsnC family transcriptional regulator [Vibrio sp. vnigr-6D03]RTZ21459.1 Lrp/AsnC family transcriptional regulator [Vibrio penaeicida]GLQ75162.1 transcriptional regulator [Vibrio penaeicida]
MLTSIIFFNVERDKINAVAEQLAGLKEMSEVFSVSGAFDLIAIVRVNKADDLSRLVTEEMIKIEGITKTDTMLAFKAYSRHDLESMFSFD